MLITLHPRVHSILVSDQGQYYHKPHFCPFPPPNPKLPRTFLTRKQMQTEFFTNIFETMSLSQNYRQLCWLDVQHALRFEQWGWNVNHCQAKTYHLSKWLHWEQQAEMKVDKGRIGIRKQIKSINSLNHTDATIARQQMLCANKNLSAPLPCQTSFARKHTEL